MWQLDLAEVEAELALAGLHRGVGVGVQFGLVLNGEQMRVQDFPTDDGGAGNPGRTTRERSAWYEVIQRALGQDRATRQVS